LHYIISYFKLLSVFFSQALFILHVIFMNGKGHVLCNNGIQVDRVYSVLVRLSRLNR